LTLVGPHRDDLRFAVDGVDMTTYASRGQGRTIAVALKLAEIELMRGETGQEPVLLLDDVMSELDKPRRAALSHAILGAAQAIVSATDLDDFTDEFLDGAKIWRVSEGKIQPSENTVGGSGDAAESFGETPELAAPAGARDAVVEPLEPEVPPIVLDDTSSNDTSDVPF
jgi:hypothetical protein